MPMCRRPAVGDALRAGGRPGSGGMVAKVSRARILPGACRRRRPIPASLQQQRVQGQAHTGQGCEWLQVVGRQRHLRLHQPRRGPAAGHRRVAAQRVDPLGPGRAAVGRRHHPPPRRSTRGPASRFSPACSAPIYSDPGRWQQLRIEGIPRLLARQVRRCAANWARASTAARPTSSGWC